MQSATRRRFRRDASDASKPLAQRGAAGNVATLTLTVTAGFTQPPNPGTTGVSHPYPTNPGPAINPHKGWNSGWCSAQPESSVGFQYLAWKDFEPTNSMNQDLGCVRVLKDSAPIFSNSFE